MRVQYIFKLAGELLTLPSTYSTPVPTG